MEMLLEQYRNLDEKEFAHALQEYANYNEMAACDVWVELLARIE